MWLGYVLRRFQGVVRLAAAILHEAQCVENTELIVSTLTVSIFQFARLQVDVNLYTEFAMTIGW